jgi:RNA polymerase sigma-70 factor (sigma-E family)
VEADAAFATFVDEHGDSLLRLAYLLEGTQCAAEDLLQDVLLRIHEHWERVAAAENTKAYVRKMVINRHLSLVRKRATTRQLLASLRVWSQETLPDPTEAVAQRDRLKRVLVGLPPRQRTAIVLRYFEDLDDVSIAEAMGITTSSVRSALARALDNLRSEMTNESDRSFDHVR